MCWDGVMGNGECLEESDLGFVDVLMLQDFYQLLFVIYDKKTTTTSTIIKKNHNHL